MELGCQHLLVVVNKLYCDSKPDAWLTSTGACMPCYAEVHNELGYQIRQQAADDIHRAKSG